MEGKRFRKQIIILQNKKIKLKKLILIFSSIIALGAGTILGQSGDSCLYLVEKYLENSSKVGFPQPGQVYEMVLSQQSEIVEQGVPPLMDVEIRVFMNDKLVILESGPVCVYADRDEVFYIYHDQKLIHQGDGFDTLFKSNNPAVALKQQLELLSSCELLNCKQSTVGGRNILQLHLKPTGSLLKSTHINHLRIDYLHDESRIYRVVLEYGFQSKLKKQTITYKKIDFESNIKLKGTARDRVINAQGVLHKQYKGYSLIDNYH